MMVRRFAPRVDPWLADAHTTRDDSELHLGIMPPSWNLHKLCLDERMGMHHRTRPFLLAVSGMREHLLPTSPEMEAGSYHQIR